MMATQAALIAETIAGMKRMLTSKNDSSDSDGAVNHATNRGNKLKRKAQFAHEGQLYSQRRYKTKTEHAGYSRYILSRNPKRYDYYGDELDEDDDNAADAVSLVENPYGDLKIEELLKPLTSAAELPNHPTISNIYTSPVLNQMVRQACEMVQREEKTLWQVKKLAMAFRGDQDRITGLEICSAMDSTLFEPEQSNPLPCQIFRQPQESVQNMQDKCIDIPDVHYNTRGDNVEPPPPQLQSGQQGDENPTVANLTSNLNDTHTLEENEDVGIPELKNQDESVNGRIRMAEYSEAQNLESSTEVATDGGMDKRSNQRELTLHNDSTVREQENETKVPSHRMTTRAQAHTASDKTIPSAPRSPSPAASETASIHPIFHVALAATPDADRALPPMEAEETRAILFLWVQKQEEVVRGTVRMYEGLLKANWMRKSVFTWCKAEGHLGEMSDGEDWYDKEEWGLDEDLRKGQEEEEDEAVNPSKKTRGRRVQ